MFKKIPNRAVKTFAALVLLSACSGINAGVETGNPTGRIIQGRFDGDSEGTRLPTLVTGEQTAELTELSDACNNPGILEVEARATDLSGKVRAMVANDRFEITVDPLKAYAFVIFGDDDPCGYLVFDRSEDISTDRPERAVVGPGTEDIDLGTLRQYSDTFILAWAASDNPAMTSDIDEDGTVDALDDDVNGDGTEDFDGNYDGFINVADPADTGVPDTCDIINIEGEQRAETGTVTLNGTAKLVLTFTQPPAAFDASLIRIYDVDEEEELITASSIDVPSLTGTDTLEIELDLAVDHDFLITLPTGTFTCADDSEQSRDISHYFRLVEIGISCSSDLDC